MPALRQSLPALSEESNTPAVNGAPPAICGAFANHGGSMRC